MAKLSILDHTGLNNFLENLKKTFSKIGHTHTISDITDYSVDASLSSTSTKPVQNKVVKSALDAKVSTTRTINGKPLTDNISLTASDIGADSSGAANNAVSAHNTSGTAHDDIRNLINDLDTGKVDKVSGKALSSNDYTTTEKNKLSGIASGANKTTVDSSLSSTSTNPVQNKVINSALTGKLSTSGGTMSGSLVISNNLTVTGNGWVDGTFTLNGASASSSAGDIVILDDGNELHTRTTDQIRSDIGAASSGHDHSKAGIYPAAIELTPASTSAGHGGYIDFHYNASTADYTTRIIEGSSGTLTLTGKMVGANYMDYTTPRFRNIYAGTSAMTAGTTALSNGAIYLQYES